MSYRILQGDVIDMLRTLPDESVDAVVTDPPYELGFMGKGWDSRGIAYNPAMWSEVLRVLKPGGHLLSFGGSRTYHRMAVAVEDGGFEIRDQIQWIFGSGFPKSLNVSKAIDSAAGEDRMVVGKYKRPDGTDRDYEDWKISSGEWKDGSGFDPSKRDLTEPTTDAAKQWDGWGTALKPAHEPIVVARKPFKGTVAANVLAYGTGAINIAGCRVEGEAVPINRLEEWSGFGQMKRPDYEQTMNTAGRWPANVIHDGSDEVLAAFPDRQVNQPSGISRGETSGYQRGWGDHTPLGFGDVFGSAARFFYAAKASREDRNEGCEEFDKKPLNWSSGTQSPGTFQAEGTDRTSRNNHPTVKPTDLMRYLCRLVTPPGGTVLDCFMGSGSTGKAALYEGFEFIGIDEDADYCVIAKARMDHVIATDAPLLRQAVPA